jgi:hypothetical protein
MLYFTLIGALLPLPVWLMNKRWPKSWLRYINIPVLLTGASYIPPGTGINYVSWFIVGFIFQFWMRRHRFRWWSKVRRLPRTSARSDVEAVQLRPVRVDGGRHFVIGHRYRSLSLPHSLSVADLVDDSSSAYSYLRAGFPSSGGATRVRFSSSACKSLTFHCSLPKYSGLDWPAVSHTTSGGLGSVVGLDDVTRRIGCVIL